jgi:hypothetical protein
MITCFLIIFTQVRYSIPTRRQPIPRQTVSIYFTIDVSKIKLKVTIHFAKLQSIDLLRILR